MIISFNCLQTKDAEQPAELLTIGGTIVENVPNLPTPVCNKSVDIQYASLTAPQKVIVDNFVALLKSKV